MYIYMYIYIYIYIYSLSQWQWQRYLNTDFGVANCCFGSVQYITIQEFNKLTSENVTARVVKANLLSKNDIANFVKKTDRDDKLRYLNKDVPSDKNNMYLLKIY